MWRGLWNVQCGKPKGVPTTRQRGIGPGPASPLAGARPTLWRRSLREGCVCGGGGSLGVLVPSQQPDC